MKMRYKFKIGELVLCRYATFDGVNVDTLALVLERKRERVQWTEDCVYLVLLQQHPNDKLQVIVEEKCLSKVK
jgi:hypothetical protein